MVRLSVVRPAAAPMTSLQRDRVDRMLLVAARLGAGRGLDEVQMGEVAAEAGVALGTLYRYFPTKHHLFAGVLAAAVRAVRAPARAAGNDDAEAVAELMAVACRSMLASPLLARAMITSVNAVRVGSGAQGDTTFRDLIVEVAGRTSPSDDDLRLARLVEQCAYGVLTWAVAGECTPEEAEDDVRRACLLLLAPWRS